MPGGSLNCTGPLLSNVTVKGYREFLKRLRQNEEANATSNTFFLHAKAKALSTLQGRRNQGTAKLQPREAFQKLKGRLLSARAELRELREAHSERLRAAYAALVEHRQLAKEQRKEQQADVEDVVGQNNLMRRAVLGTVGGLGKGFMSLLTSTDIQGAEALQAAFERPPQQGLITVSNHTAALDDPLLLALMMPVKHLLEPSKFRWGMCATDRCFKTDLLTAFFKAGKTLPVARGKGLEQAGMWAARQRLGAGEWVHIFPEGTRSRDGKMGPVRKGIGHIISTGSTPPLVLPFVHSGMEDVLPPGRTLPRIGQQVRIRVGEPISFEDLATQAKEEQWPQDRLSAAITQRVASILYTLKAELDGLAVADITDHDKSLQATPEESVMALIDDFMDATNIWHQPSRLDKRWQGCEPATLAASSSHSLSSAAMGLAQGILTAMGTSENPRTLSVFHQYWQSRISGMRRLALQPAL